VRAGLRESGLVEGRDYETKAANAQGDMATVSALLDAALSENADLLITLSSPTLQAAIRKTRTVPIVFCYVASGEAAGAGRSDTDHRPNVTGVNLLPKYGAMLALIEECMPSVRRVGTLFVPAEVNSVLHKDLLTQAAAEAGLEVVAVPASTASEVPDAALALTSRGIDVICQIPGNLTASAFPSLVPAAQRAHLPIFAFQTVQAHQGAIVVLATDYAESGRLAGLLAARVMRGESPAGIPFQHASGEGKLLVNLRAAQAIGLRLPPALVARAQPVQ
jgi:putative tryptophan/tyrosine transport system substrate-binding protein